MIQNVYRQLRESRIPWFLFYAGLTIELLIVIVDKSNYLNPIESYLFRITFLLFALKLVFTGYDRREWAVILALEAVGFVSYRITGANDIIRIVTFVAACKNIPLKQMLRYTFYVTLTGCLVIILLSVTGIYGEISLTQAYGHESAEETRYIGKEAAEETRYTLGMGHPNALSCMFLMLTVLGVYLYFSQMRWYVYLFLMLLNAGVYALTGSKTSMLITTAFLAGACVMTYCRALRQKAFAYVCGALIFACCLGFSVDAAVCAQRVRDAQWNEFFYLNPRDNEHIVALGKIDRYINGRIISLTNSGNNDGMIHTWSAFSNENNMGYSFDMGWVKLFYRYGVIPGILYVAACLALLWQLYKRKDACGLVLFVTFAVYTVVEAHLISVYVGRNYLLMMMGTMLLSQEKAKPHTDGQGRTMIRVLMVGPDRSVHGGISGVVNNYYEAGLDRRITLCYIGTMVEGSRGRKLLKAAEAYVKFLTRLPFYGIVHVNMASDNSYRRKAVFIRTAHFFRKKIVIHQHGGDFETFYDKEQSERGRRKIQKVLGMGDAFLVLAPLWKKYFGQIIGEETITVLPDSIAIPEAFPKRYDNHKVLFLGRLCREKGIGELLSCVPELVKRVPDFHLYLGGIWEDPGLQMMAEQDREHITWLGWVSGEEKRKWLTECRLLALPSYFEGQSVSLLEAMAYYCGIVASDTGGIPQMIQQEETGLLVTPKDADSLQEGLLRLLQDDELCRRLGSAARNKVEREFDIEENMRKLTAVYERL